MSELRDDIAEAPAMYVNMVARCYDMLARCDSFDGSEAAEIRAEVLEIVAELETLNYWLDCVERRHQWLEKQPPELPEQLDPTLH